MSITNQHETQYLTLVYNNDDITLIGDAAGLLGSATAGSFYVSLHTGDPGEAGDQTTSEATYTSYARVAVARTTGGFTVSGNSVSNAAAVTFAECTGGSNTITYFGIGTASSGSGGKLLGSGALTSSLAVSANITPEFAIGALTHTVD